MKFKPIALVVIGLLLGSTITLLATRSSSSNNEVLACTSKKSGKVRLTVTGPCDKKTEDQSQVTDLWSLQPVAPSTTQPPQLKKHVVDANGQDLGEFVTQEGLNLFWTNYKGGLFSLDNSGGVGGTISSWDPPIFEDKACRRPYIGYPTNKIDSTTRAIVKIMPISSSKAEPQQQAFQVKGNLVPLPSSVYFYVTPRMSRAYLITKKNNLESAAFHETPWQEKPGCVLLPKQVAFDLGIGGRPPKRIYRSTPVSTPTFYGPLSIVEK